jgi:hypothetical protein
MGGCFEEHRFPAHARLLRMGFESFDGIAFARLLCSAGAVERMVVNGRSAVWRRTCLRSGAESSVATSEKEIETLMFHEFIALNRRGWSSVSPALVALLLCAVAAEAQQPGSVPISYRAISTRAVHPEPALPVPGPAGSLFTDPTFGSRIIRVTDAHTRPGAEGRSFTTASAAHQLAWSAASDKFWVRSVDGTYIPYTFDANTMTVARIEPARTGDGGLTISSLVEPQFSFLSSNLLFGARQDQRNDWPIIRQFDFNTLTYRDLLDLGAITTISAGTFAAALSSSATAPETLSVIFGGPAQDSHFKVVVFQSRAPAATAVVVDTVASTITRDGVTSPTTGALRFFLHHAWIDPSGRYVMLTPVNASPAPFVLWDLQTDVFTRVTTRAEGHDALGFARQVNQSCCTATTYDGAQWQLRALSSPATTTDLIAPVLLPQEVFIADHTSWNNAQPGTGVPILSSLYRYYNGTFNTTPWRAWDDEIVAIQTDAHPLGATVWRFAHHRSDVSPDGGGGAVYFWYLPRAIISPNGRWAIFSSNWEKSLGATVGSDIEPGGLHRSDVFLVALVNSGFTDETLSPGVSVVKAVHVTELRARIDALRADLGLAPFAWTDPALGPGTAIKVAHPVELLTALQQVYAAAGRSRVFNQAIIEPGTFIRLAHIQELRDAVIALETPP